MQVTHRHIPADDPLDALMAGRIKCVEFNGDQVCCKGLAWHNVQSTACSLLIYGVSNTVCV